jgi:hypothetical protein
MRRNGITAFVALLLPHNERMLRLLRAVGPTQIRAESGTVEVQVDIIQAEAALAPTSTWCEAHPRA